MRRGASSHGVAVCNTTLRQPSSVGRLPSAQGVGSWVLSAHGSPRTKAALHRGMLALLSVSLLASMPCSQGQLLEGGGHVRLTTLRGPVHLWCRAGSEPQKIVVYVHGYRDDVDSAFKNHQLAAQFAKSGVVDALFIAVAAPSGAEHPVMFGDLDELLERVGAPVAARVLVIGHSGGNRTLKAWLRSTRVEEVVLLDGFYGDAAPWTRWLTERPGAVLRAVGQHTFVKAEAWRLSLPEEVREQVTHERAACGHMEIVTAGDWLPRVIAESAHPFKTAIGSSLTRGTTRSDSSSSTSPMSR